jgi:hypothetical protein
MFPQSAPTLDGIAENPTAREPTAPPRYFARQPSDDTTAKTLGYSGHEIAIFAELTFGARFVMRACEKAT